MAGTARPRRSWKKILLWAIGVAVVVFIAIQFVPYGRSSHSNPAASNPFQWTDPQAEAIARESCYDCQYTLIHPNAKLTDAEKQTLVQGYEAGAAAGSAAEAQALIDDMIQRGAQVTPAEQQALVRYFTQ